MYYRKWDESEIDGFKGFCGIETLYAEIGKDGNVLREIGLNKAGKVVHKCPSCKYPYGTYGFFDNQRIEITNYESNITREEFEKLWKE